ncbi:hypothetical protein F511_39305 [Dorcoceras hygrometricum]|uniref:Uncharacterized protein n=1 Tax=Dorcoceras hygrometricum TaxID=472368 RepID=A0A2Z7DFD9_9LAMI|nr:hypothetical protein F511_39305 [Dorcoceras hygrometricum]
MKELIFWSWTELDIDSAVQSLKCQFPRGIGRIQAPRRLQVSRGNRHFTVGGGRLRQSGPRPETISLRSAYTRRLMDFIINGFSSKSWPEQVRRSKAAAAADFERGEGAALLARVRVNE